MIPVEALGALANAQAGSPASMQSLGRIMGLGLEEQAAVAKGEFPRWAIAVTAIAVGFVAGCYVAGRYPKVGKTVAGV